MILVFDKDNNWVMTVDSDSLTIPDIKMLYFDTLLFYEGPSYVTPTLLSITTLEYVYVILKIEYRSVRRDPYQMYEIDNKYDYILIDTKFSEEYSKIDFNDNQFGFVNTLVKSWIRTSKLKSIGV